MGFLHGHALNGGKAAAPVQAPPAGVLAEDVKAVAPASATAEQPGIGVFMDIACRRLDHQDRASDRLNVKAGAVLGFTTFILPNGLTLLERLYAPQWLKWQLGAALLFVYLGVLYSCYRAYRAEAIRTFPDVKRMVAEGHARQSELKAKEAVFRCIETAFADNTKRLDDKATYVNRALVLLVIQILLMVVGSGLRLIMGVRPPGS